MRKCGKWTDNVLILSFIHSFIFYRFISDLFFCCCCQIRKIKCTKNTPSFFLASNQRCSPYTGCSCLLGVKVNVSAYESDENLLQVIVVVSKFRPLKLESSTFKYVSPWEENVVAHLNKIMTPPSSFVWSNAFSSYLILYFGWVPHLTSSFC